MRNCYAAALNAGGKPSGAPGCRKDDYTCFNAAVEDPDDNTLEFIFREPGQPEQRDELSIPQVNRAQTWQDSESRSRRANPQRDVQASQTHSRARTALDLASEASKATRKSESRAPGITRSRTDPVATKPRDNNKGLVGTLIGAAAGAALLVSMTQSERDGARKEAAYAASVRSKGSSARNGTHTHGRRSSLASFDREGSSRNSRLSAKHSDRGPQKLPWSMRAIEARAPEDRANHKVHQVVARYRDDARPPPQRSQTYDGAGFASRIGKSSSGGDRYSMKRASTLPTDYRQTRLLEAPRSTRTSNHAARGALIDDDLSLQRHDSGVSMRPSPSKPSRRKAAPRRDSMYESPAAKTSIPASPLSTTKGHFKADEDHDDGLGDLDTVVPDDSISCVDFSRPTRSSTKSKSSRADSERNVRPAARAARSLPVQISQQPRGGRRDTHSRA